MIETMFYRQPILAAGMFGAAEEDDSTVRVDSYCCDSEGVSGASEELEYYHETVLLEEAVHYMAPAEGKVLVDGTLGGGGHTERMLEAGATVYGIDRDPEALEYAGRRLKRFGDRFRPVKGNFTDAKELLAGIGVSAVDGV